MGEIEDFDNEFGTFSGGRQLQKPGGSDKRGHWRNRQCAHTYPNGLRCRALGTRITGTKWCCHHHAPRVNTP